MHFYGGGGYLADYTINFPLWFLHTLFIADICMFFIIKANKYWKILIFVLLIFITIPFQTAVPGRPVFHINVLPAALVYMLLGYGIHMLIDVKSNKIHISHGILLIFVGWRMSNTYGGAISQIGNLCYFFESFCTIIGILILVTRAKKYYF